MRGVIEALEAGLAMAGGFCAAWLLPPLVAVLVGVAVIAAGFLAVLLPTRRDAERAGGPW